MPTLPFIQAASAEVPYAAPDWSFLQGQLDRANQRYEEGLQEIKSNYSAVFNADITNDENKAKRAEYIKQLNEGLKSIAGLDVSDPKVMRQADSLISPFWQDQDLLSDITLTKKAKSEIQRGLSASMSKDEDVRNSFDEASLKPIYHSLKRLKTAKRGSQEFNSIEVPNWTPFINVGNYMSDFKENEKPEITWDEVQGQYIITHTNGADSLPGWITMVNGKLDKRFDPQFNIYGTNYVNDLVDQYINANPGATEQDARNAIAKEYYTPMYEGRKKLKDSYDAAYNGVLSQLESLEKIESAGGKLTDKQQTQKALYKMKLDGLAGMKKQATIQFEDINKPDTLKNLSFNLEKFFGQQIRQETVEGYAESFAADKGESIKENTAHFSALNYNAKLAEIDETRNWHNYQMQKDFAEMEFNKLKLGLEHPEYALMQGVGATGLPPGSRPSSQAVQLASTATDHDMYAEDISNMRNEITNNLFHGTNDKYRGVSQLLLDKSVGLTIQELDVFNKYQSANQSGTLNYTKDGKFIPESKEDGALYNSAVRKLSARVGNKPLNTPDDVTGALVTYAQSWITNTKKNMSDPDALQYYTNAISSASRTYREFTDLEKTKASKIKALINSDPNTYSKISIERKPGEYDVVNTSDISNILQKTGLSSITLELPDGTTRILTTDEISKAYINGNFDIDDPLFKAGANATTGSKIAGSFSVGSMKRSQATFNNEPVKIVGINNEEGFAGKRWYKPEGLRSKYATVDLYPYLKPVLDRYGSPTNLRNNLKDIASKVVPNPEYYKQRRGEIPTTVTIPVSDKFESNLRYVQDAMDQGNIGNITTSDGQPLSLTDRQKLRNLINSNPKALGSNIKYFYSSSVFSPRKLELMIEDTPGSGDLRGKTVYLDVSPATISPLLKRLPMNQEERYDPLYTTPETESPADKAIGLTYRLRYEKQTDRFLIDGTFKTTDPKTGNDKTITFSNARSAKDGGANAARILAEQSRNQFIQQDINNQKRYLGK